MDPKYKPFAPYALALSGLALLTAGGLYFVLREFDLYVQIALGVAVIGLAITSRSASLGNSPSTSRFSELTW